jgi:hypothetical protein
MPVSNRHQYAARKAAPTATPTSEYEILDPGHKPDLKGEFAGARVQRRDNKQVVSLTDSQAKFYLDSGSIAPLNVSDGDMAANRELTTETAHQEGHAAHTRPPQERARSKDKPER